MEGERLKIEELRIGNYVNIHGGGDNTFCKPDQPRFLGEITSLSKGHIGYDSLDPMPKYCHSSCESIPIDKEWLERLGFKKNCHGRLAFEFKVRRKILEIEMEQYDQLIFGDDQNCIYWMGVKMPCKYVHQLQNLVFAISGQNLKLLNVEQLNSEQLNKG